MSKYKHAGISYERQPFDVDRTWVLEELSRNPALIPRWQSLLHSEANPRTYGYGAQRAVAESMMNRAAAHGTSLADVLGQERGQWGRAYYAPYHDGSYFGNYKTANNDRWSPHYNDLLGDAITDPVMPFTHNASLGVARNAMKGRNDAIPYRQGGGQWVGDRGKEYVYAKGGKNFRNEENFLRMATTKVPTPGANPARVAANGLPSDLAKKQADQRLMDDSMQIQSEWDQADKQGKLNQYHPSVDTGTFRGTDWYGIHPIHRSGKPKQQAPQQAPQKSRGINPTQNRVRPTQNPHTESQARWDNPVLRTDVGRTSVSKSKPKPTSYSAGTGFDPSLPERKPKMYKNALTDSGGLPDWADEAFGNIWGE